MSIKKKVLTPNRTLSKIRSGRHKTLSAVTLFRMALKHGISTISRKSIMLIIPIIYRLITKLAVLKSVTDLKILSLVN